MAPRRVAIIETHPIQYKVPWFRALAACDGLDPQVFYAMIPDAVQQGAGFGVAFTWDQPLLEGYRYEVLRNAARTPSVEVFQGCDTPDLYRLIRQAKPRWDAVIVNGWVVKMCLQALAAARLAGVPCIVRGESNAIRRRQPWKRWLHRLLLAQYAGVLYIGASNRRFYRDNGVPERRLHFGPYSVDNARFERESVRWRAERAGLRAAWRIPEKAFCFVFSGKLVPKKRPLDILQALRAVRAGQGPAPAVSVLMVGEGELRSTCEAYCREYALPVTFAGFLNQSEIPKAYAAADALILPSDDGETWGLVVNEAMASGLPAIVSDRVGCQADLVEPGVTGAVFPLGDTDGLARCMRELASCADRGAALGQAARARVARYSVENLVQGTRAAIEAVCGGRGWV